MGIYYSSVGTRLQNVLRENELTVEDFAVLDPCLIKFFRNCGRKSVAALVEALEEKGMQPGKYMGPPLRPYYEAVPYYKEHKAEILEENPIVYIEKPEASIPEESVRMETFRREVAKDILLKLVCIGEYRDSVDQNFFAYRTFVPSFTADSAADYAVKAADALIERLK